MKPELDLGEIPIPRGWTDDEAEAVLDFLFAIQEALWDEYGTRLKARRRKSSPRPTEEPVTAPKPRQDFDVPF